MISHLVMHGYDTSGETHLCHLFFLVLKETDIELNKTIYACMKMDGNMHFFKENTK